MLVFQAKFIELRRVIREENHRTPTRIAETKKTRLPYKGDASQVGKQIL
jgi:hypothetical protein